MYIRIVIDRDLCIACGACITYCPHQALIAGDDGKPVLLWDRCRDDFACLYVCPVNAISPCGRRRGRGRWFYFSKNLEGEELQEFVEWKSLCL
ncbi:MAG: ATP-binding protein [Pyrobaculum sp.]